MRELTHLREARLTQAPGMQRSLDPCVHDRRPDSGMDGTLVVRTGEAWFYLHFEEVNRLSGFFSKTISHFSTFDSQWTVPSPCSCSVQQEGRRVACFSPSTARSHTGLRGTVLSRGENSYFGLERYQFNDQVIP